MTNIDNDLRELLQEKASEAGSPFPVPSRVLMRGRRRQGMTALAAGLVVAAVVAGSIAGTRGLLRSQRTGVAGGGSSTTIQSFTFDRPAGWTLLDLWPLAMAIPTSTQTSGSSGVGGSSVIPQPAGLPVFELANYDPGLPGIDPEGAGVDFCPKDVPDAGVVLYVALNSDLMQGASADPGYPATIDPNAAPLDGPCGAGLYAESTAAQPYFSFLVAGPAASPADLETAAVVWNERTQVATELFPLPDGVSPLPGYVIDSGETDGVPWNLEARQGSRGLEILEIDAGPHPTEALSATSFEGVKIIDGSVSWGETGPTIGVGVVMPGATRVEFRPDGGGASVPGSIVPLPTSFDSVFNAFIVVAPNGGAGAITSIAADGSNLGGIFFGSGSSVPSDVVAADRTVQADLRNSLVAAKTYYTDGGTYTGFSPEIAASIEPSLNFDSSAVASEGSVSIRAVTATTVLLVEKSASGAVFCIADIPDGTTYGAADAQTVAECAGGSDEWGVPAATPTPQQPSGDEATQMELRNALVAALTYHTDSNSFEGFTPKTAAFIEPSLTYNSADPLRQGEITIRAVTKDTVLLVSLTPSGDGVFCIAQNYAGGGTTYGTVDAQKIDECSETAWPPLPSP